MSRIAALSLALVTLVTLAVACSGDDDGLSVDATGSVLGLVWLDRNGNATLEGSDGPVGDVRVQLVPAAGGGPAYSAVTTAGGEFRITDVLVGDYQVVLDRTTVGDTLRLLALDSSSVTVEADDSSVVTVGLTYPAVPVDSARRAPIDTRLFVEGLVLSRWGTYGEASLHVRDSTGAIQGVRVAQTNVIPGDSVRLLGVVSAQTGQPVIKDGFIFLLRTGVQSPEPREITTAMAASADDGALDADLVRLDSAVVTDTSRTAAGEFIFTVDDGSGPVAVVLDGQIQFSLSFDEIVGTILDVTGILVPSSAGGSWQVRPRSNSDLVVGPLSWPTLPIDEARDEPVDTRLIIEGLALNGWGTFGDSTVHVRDATGAIRAIRVPPANIAAGDSIRVVGTIASLRNQPVLTRVLLRRQEAGFQSPAPDTVATATAAAAGAGALDAELIHVENAVVQDTSRTTAGEFVFTVDDGSGPVDVVLDAQILFSPQFGGAILGSTLDVTGLLVPAATGTRWLVKPRQNDDLVVQ